MNKNILKNIESPNLAEQVLDSAQGESKLNRLGSIVFDNHDENQESMRDWEEVLKTGIEMSRPDDQAKSTPWDGAANYKSQIANESIKDFGDKAVMEVLGQPDLVAADYEGESNTELDDVCERISNHLNYQVNQEMSLWRKEQKSLFYQLAAQGSLFKKTWFDPVEGHNVSEVIGYPDFSINNKCKSLKDDSNFTQVKYYSPNEIYERQAQGQWLDMDLMPTEHSDYQHDKDQYRFLEQFINFDLDDDGYAEPLLVTVHEESQKVVRIVPMYDQDTIVVNYDGVTATLSEIQERVLSEEPLPFSTPEEHLDYTEERLKEVVRDSELVSIKQIDILTFYGFFNPADGTLLHYGYYHTMTSSIKGINKSSNSLFNAGDLANMQTGVLSKEYRDKRKGNISFKPNMWRQTNISAQDLPNSIVPLPIKEPSQTLLGLNENLKEETRQQGTKTDVGQMMSPNIPAASVLGVLQEGVIPTSALMHNLVESMSSEFKVMYELNRRFTDPQVYAKLNGGADYEADYSEDLSIKPTANAKFSSQFQRVQLAQVQMEQTPLILQAGGNVMPIIKYFFEAIGSDLYDQVFEQEMTPQEQQQMQQMQAMQQAQLEAQQKQAQILEQEYQLRVKEEDRKSEEANAKIVEMAAEQERKDAEQVNKTVELEAKLKQWAADTIKTLQESEKIDAETADIKHREVMDMFEKAVNSGVDKVSITKLN